MASPSSPSTGPRCATHSVRRRSSSCPDAFELARDDPQIGVIVLTGEGTKAFCSGGDQRVRGDDGYRDRQRNRPPQRSRPAGADPAAAQAGDRHGRGLRHRRRPCSPPGLRPHDRRRQRRLRSDRPEGGLVRRRLRIRAAGAHRSASSGQGDLVPLRAVRRGHGRALGPGEHGRAARAARSGDGRSVCSGCSR